MTPERFKEIRLQLGVKQGQLAPMIGHTTANKVSAFECGRLEIPAHVAIIMDLYAQTTRPSAAEIVAEIERRKLSGKNLSKATAAALNDLTDWILQGRTEGAEIAPYSGEVTSDT